MNLVRLAWAMRSGDGVQSAAIHPIMSRRDGGSRLLGLDDPEGETIAGVGRRRVGGLGGGEYREQLFRRPPVLRRAGRMERPGDRQMRRHTTERSASVKRR